ncbi:MAG: PrsW family intramembrane metalloprotease [Akkermansia sp.]|nr:PrsW family intramembrane metalloprotease [Akkermansia sp.]
MACTAPLETYHILLPNGEQDGPYTLQELQEMHRSGLITADTEIRSSKCGCPLRVDELLHPSEKGTLDDITGLNGLGGFSLWHFFADVFRHHSREEVLDIFCCGTPGTTPPLHAVSSAWPTPWIFARMLLACILLYFGFNWACNTFQNPNLVPGLMFVGNFAIPFCVAVFFFELNVRREVPFLEVMRAMFYGGLMSLIFALGLVSVSPHLLAWIAGPIEEPAKLVAAILIAGSRRNGRILTGLLLGAGVGAGFAAFESSGYTFAELARFISSSTAAQLITSINPAQGYAMAQNANLINPDAVMQVRALITPFGHIVWTAISAGAYWLALKHRIAEGRRPCNATGIDWAAFADVRFLRIAIVPVVLHLVWNTTWLEEFGLLRFLILGVIAWAVALRLVHAGLQQIREEKCSRGLPM